VSKDPRVYLAQILERIERIESYTAGGQATFLDDPMVQDAVIRNFEVIGEAPSESPTTTGMRTPRYRGGRWPPSAMC